MKVIGYISRALYQINIQKKLREMREIFQLNIWGKPFYKVKLRSFKEYMIL